MTTYIFSKLKLQMEDALEISISEISEMEAINMACTPDYENYWDGNPDDMVYDGSTCPKVFALSSISCIEPLEAEHLSKLWTSVVGATTKGELIPLVVPSGKPEVSPDKGDKIIHVDMNDLGNIRYHLIFFVPDMNYLEQYEDNIWPD